MPIYRLVSDFIAHHYGYTEKRKKNLIHFANYHGKIDMLIFFTAEEKKRKFAIKLSYPLIDMNFTRESIQFAIKELGHPPIHSLSVRYMPLSDRFTIRVF